MTSCSDQASRTTVSRLVIREWSFVTSLMTGVLFAWISFFSSSLHTFNTSPFNIFLFFTRKHQRKGEKLDFVQCIGCSLVLMYRSRTGTASLLRHRCARFPVSVQDQKQEAAGRYAELLSDMASSSHNAMELKQEVMSDEESLDLKLMNDSDQQFTNEQTNKGLMESFSLLEKSFMTVDELMLTREEVELAQRNNDPQLFFER